MLITTGHNPRIFDQPFAYAPWPGPHCLCIDLGTSLSKDQIEALQENFIIFDFTAPTANALDLLRQVVLKAEGTAAAPTGPLLFSHVGPAPDEIEALLVKTSKDPLVVDYLLQPEDGDIEQLILGASIVATSLFWTYFRNMEAGMGTMHTETSLKLIKKHFVMK